MNDARQDSSIEEISGQPDHYVNHLAAVNQTKGVVSTEDIRNKNGILLLCKGARISPDAAQKILQHKLAKPLDQQVQIENSASGATLVKSFATFLEKYPDVRQVHEGAQFELRFRKLLSDPNHDPILLQKITVLQTQQEPEFEKAIFCAWLGALLAVEMNLSGDLVGAAFLAGLVHDLGLLHIPAEFVNKQGELSSAEWRAIQSHVVIGQLLIKNMKGMHPRAAVAVLEHHERCDGTGYPTGKMEEGMDVMGQIIGMADSLHAIRVKQFAKVGRNLRDAIPYLQLNATTHTTGVYHAMHALLKKSKLAPTQINPMGDFGTLVSHLCARSLQLKGVVNVLDGLMNLSSASNAGAEAKKMQRVIEPVAQMMRSSGLLGADILNWLDTLQSQPDDGAMPELVEIDLMQNELGWQLKKVQRALSEFLEKEIGSLTPDEDRLYAKIHQELVVSLNKP